MGSTTATNLKILGTVVVTLGVYTWVANAIPQVESAVPKDVSFSGDVTADQLVSAGQEVFTGSGGCTACHGLGTRAPNLRTDFNGEGPIGARCGDRKPGMSCKEYLHESLVDPHAYIVEGFGPIMPAQGALLTNNQLWAVIAYLESLGGQVDVTAADIESGEGGGAPATPASSGGGAGATGGGDVPEGLALMRQNTCFGCHMLNGEGQEVGPHLDGIGSRATKEYIRRSIVDPGAEAAKGYESLLGTMPPNFAQIMTDDQIDSLVDYLASQK